MAPTAARASHGDRQSHRRHRLRTLDSRPETGEKKWRVHVGTCPGLESRPSRFSLPDDPVVVPMVAGSTPEAPFSQSKKTALMGPEVRADTLSS